MIKHIFLFFIGFSLSAQDSLQKNKFEPALNTYLGYLVPAYPNTPESKYASLSSIGCSWQTRGKDKWHQLYNFPKFGVDAFYGTFDNPKELGHNFGLVPSFELRGKNKRNVRFKFGLGNAWYNKTYDIITNENNFYIGRHFTSMVNVGLYWTTRLSKKMTLTYGFSSLHCSDGHTALPNAGMNILSGHLGIRFEEQQQCQKTETPKQISTARFGMRIGYGAHKFGATTKAVGGPSYPTYHVSGWYHKAFNNIHVLQLGATFSYYSSFYDYIISQEVYKTDQQIRSCTGVAFIGHEFVFGKFSFVSQAGIYFYNPFFIKQKKIEGSWSSFGQKLEAINTNRVGITYYPFKKRNSLNDLGKQFSMSVLIKANVGQADLYEYALGFIF
jgi:hypothetical protein